MEKCCSEACQEGGESLSMRDAQHLEDVSDSGDDNVVYNHVRVPNRAATDFVSTLRDIFLKSVSNKKIKKHLDLRRLLEEEDATSSSSTHIDGDETKLGDTPQPNGHSGGASRQSSRGSTRQTEL